MKKILIYILFAVLMITFASCGTGKDNNSQSNMPSQSEPTEDELIELATASALRNAIKEKKYIIEGDDSRGGYINGSYISPDHAKMSITSIKDYAEHNIDCWMVKGKVSFYNDYNETVKVGSKYFLYFAVIVDKQFNSKCVHLFQLEPDAF